MEIEKHKIEKQKTGSRKSESLIETKGSIGRLDRIKSKSSSHILNHKILILIQELKDYHEELKIRDEELLHEIDQVRKTAQKFDDLYDLSPLGYLTLSKQCTIEQINLTSIQLLGRNKEDLMNSLFMDLLEEPSKSVFNKFFKLIFNNKGKETCEVKLLSDDNSPLIVFLMGIASENGEQCFLTLNNITKLRQLEEAQDANKETISSLLNVCHESVFILSRSFEILAANMSMAKLFNMRVEDCVGKNIFSLLPPKIAENQKRIIDGAFLNGKSVIFEDERKGRLYSNNVTPLLNKSGSADRVTIIATDITERNLAENKLKLSENHIQIKVNQRTRELADLNRILKNELGKRKVTQKMLNQSIVKYKQLFNYLENVRELERINIARIIHDNLAQFLTTLKMELTLHKGSLEKGNQIFPNDLDSLLVIIEESLASVYSIIGELRPITFDKNGLIPTLKQLFNEFQYNSGISCDVRIKDSRISVGSEIGSAIYRVVKEILTNIRKHSKAFYVEIKISSNLKSFSITITDKGIGITPQQIAAPDSYGIIGMKERMAAINGKITIKGTEGKGTKVHLRVPIKSFT